jgi:hypothetical protein
MRRRVWLAAIAIALTSAARAHASPRSDAKKPILVLESHTGERPAYIDPLIVTLDEELETRGFAARPATILTIANGRVPRPGVLDRDQTAAAVAQLVSEGAKAYADGKLEDAAKALTSAIRSIQRNPALFVLNARNADVTFRAYATLSLVQSRSGDATASLTTMEELIRTFPARPLARGDYGPDGEKLYRDAAKHVRTLGRGQLWIDAHDAQAVIFVDGQIQGTQKAALADLIPGTYRVFIQVPGTIGRQYEVDIRANEDAHVDATHVDAWLWATDQWLGFSFPTDAERGREAKYASELARRWTGGDVVAVVGSTRLQGKPALIGSLYRVDGTALRSAVVSTSDRDAIRALAQFLANGTGVDGVQGIQVVRNNNVERDSSPTGLLARRRITRPALFWSAIGLFAAGLATGGLTLKFANDATAAGKELQATCAVSCTSDQEHALAAKQDTADRNALITGIVGGVAVTTSAVLLIFSLRHRSTGVAVVPIRGGLAASYAVEF